MLLDSGNRIRDHIPSPACQYVPPRFSLAAAPSHLPIHCAGGGYPIYSPSRRIQLQLCGWLFKTNLVQHHMGMRIDDNNLRLDHGTSEHPASRTNFQGNAPETGIDGLDDYRTRDSSCLGT